MRRSATTLAFAFALATPVAAPAQTGAMQTVGISGTGSVEQSGARAEAIRAILARIALPDGFRIDLYALVPGARHMAIGPEGEVLFVGTRGSDVWAVVDRDGDLRADAVSRFLPELDLVMPNGPCFAPDGTLYVAERNRVLMVPSAEAAGPGDTVTVIPVVPEGELIPVSEQSRVHSARVCRVGPDDRLYISLGQPYNVSPPDKARLYEETGIGGIVRMDRDGSNREVYATGIRNSVGMDFNPADGKLWFTDNQVDGMGDLIPPGELNRVDAIGLNFGFPWYGGGTTRTVQYQNAQLPEGLVPPQVEMDAHAADLGMVFYTGDRFPEKYRGGVFNAQHGSWNRTEPIGARVMFTAVDVDGNAAGTEIFAEGWLDDRTGDYLGRPVDVLQMADGSILVSDDRAGAVYRISYGG